MFHLFFAQALSLAHRLTITKEVDKHVKNMQDTETNEYQLKAANGFISRTIQTDKQIKMKARAVKDTRRVFFDFVTENIKILDQGRHSKL